MIKARDIIAQRAADSVPMPSRRVPAEMGILDVLPRVLDSAEGCVGVEEEGVFSGIVDRSSLLDGIGRLLTARDDSSEITVECYPEEYSASRLAHAVEDADAHLVDLLTGPLPEGMLRVTLRVRREDPSPVVNSLERYGYHVTDSSGAGYGDAEVALERLLELNTLLNV